MPEPAPTQAFQSQEPLATQAFPISTNVRSDEATISHSERAHSEHRAKAIWDLQLSHPDSGADVRQPDGHRRNRPGDVQAVAAGHGQPDHEQAVLVDGTHADVGEADARQSELLPAAAKRRVLHAHGSLPRRSERECAEWEGPERKRAAFVGEIKRGLRLQAFSPGFCARDVYGFNRVRLFLFLILRILR
jgi:hypothetical protein